MASYDLAIDLGSSNTTIYKMGSGIVLKEPTALCIQTSSKGNAVKEFGIKAKRMQGRTGENSVVVYPVREGVIKNEELTTSLLKYFLAKVLPVTTLKPRVRAVIGVPCGLTQEEISSYEKVAYKAGISRVSFVPSIIASAIGDKLKTGHARGSVVVNIGGGTTEIAVISLNTIINAISVGVGGKAMDVSIKDYVAEYYSINISESMAEKIKQEIGSLFETDKSNMEFNGADISSSSPVSDIISAQDVARALYNYYDKIILSIQATINSCKPDIISDISQTGVQVSGAGCKITGLEGYFRKKLNLPVVVSDNPENSVILGLGILLSDEELLRSVIDEN